MDFLVIKEELVDDECDQMTSLPQHVTATTDHAIKNPGLTPDNTRLRPNVALGVTRQSIISPSNTVQPNVSLGVTRQSIISPSNTVQPDVALGLARQNIISPSTTVQPNVALGVIRQSIISPSTVQPNVALGLARQNIILPSTTIQPNVALGVTRQSIISPSTTVQTDVALDLRVTNLFAYTTSMGTVQPNMTLGIATQSTPSPTPTMQPTVRVGATRQNIISTPTVQPTVRIGITKQSTTSPTPTVEPGVALDLRMSNLSQHATSMASHATAINLTSPHKTMRPETVSVPASIMLQSTSMDRDGPSEPHLASQNRNRRPDVQIQPGEKSLHFKRKTTLVITSNL